MFMRVTAVLFNSIKTPQKMLKHKKKVFEVCGSDPDFSVPYAED